MQEGLGTVNVQWDVSRTTTALIHKCSLIFPTYCPGLGTNIYGSEVYGGANVMFAAGHELVGEVSNDRVLGSSPP